MFQINFNEQTRKDQEACGWDLGGTLKPKPGWGRCPLVTGRRLLLMTVTLRSCSFELQTGALIPEYLRCHLLQCLCVPHSTSGLNTVSKKPALMLLLYALSNTKVIRAHQCPPGLSVLVEEIRCTQTAELGGRLRHVVKEVQSSFRSRKKRLLPPWRKPRLLYAGS